MKLVQGILYYVGNKIGKWKCWVSQTFLCQQSFFVVVSNRSWNGRKIRVNGFSKVFYILLLANVIQYNNHLKREWFVPQWFSPFKLFFWFFSSCLGIYDRTGCNRQDKTIHHAGLMWESKFNLVSLIYKYWPSREHIEHIYLSTKPGYILCPTNFSGLRFRGRVFQCFRLCRLLRVLLGVGERGYIFSSSPRSHSFDGILMTVHFLSVFISIFINE